MHPCTGRRTVVAGVRVVQHGQQKPLVELKHARLLLHQLQALIASPSTARTDLPHTVEEDGEDGRAVERLRPRFAAVSVPRRERMPEPQPLLLNQLLKSTALSIADAC